MYYYFYDWNNVRQTFTEFEDAWKAACKIGMPKFRDNQYGEYYT